MPTSIEMSPIGNPLFRNCPNEPAGLNGSIRPFDQKSGLHGTELAGPSDSPYVFGAQGSWHLIVT